MHSAPERLHANGFSAAISLPPLDPNANWMGEHLISAKQPKTYPKDPNSKTDLHREILRHTQEGLDVNEIAFAMRLGSREIRSLACDIGLQLIEGNGTIINSVPSSEEMAARRAKVRRLAAKNFTAARIRKELNIPHHVLMRDCKSMGIVLAQHAEQGVSKGLHDAEIRKLAQDGKSNAEIARTIGLSSASVSRRVKHMGLNGSWFSVSKGQYDKKIRRMLAQKKNIAEISRATGVSTTSVARRIKHLGLKSSAQSVSKGEYDAEIRELAQDGKSNAEIARTTGLSSSSVARRIKHMGLPGPSERQAKLKEAA